MPTADRNIRENTLLAKLTKAARDKKFQRFSEDSYKWFQTRVKFLGNAKSWAAILADSAATGNIKTVGTIEIGKMYAFMYLAKWRDELPYWDAFPLIFVVGPAPKGFYGINLHYLPNTLRARLMDKLLDISNNKRYDKTTKLQLSYQLLKATESLSEFKPCFKHYLNEQVQTSMMEIPANKWETVLFLPFQKFMKASSAKVWRESKKKI